MKINRNQALYKALPDNWISFKKDDESRYQFASRVIDWNTVKVDGIYEEKIINDIIRRIRAFENAGGENKNFDRTNLEQKFEFCEAKVDEQFGDIKCKISPTIFYCNECGLVESFRSIGTAPKCKCNGKYMRQLQFIYSCECGYADGIKIPFTYDKKMGERVEYHPVNTTNRDQYKFYKVSGTSRKEYQIVTKCPECRAVLYPKNAIDKHNYYPQSGKNINIFNKRFGELLKEHKDDTENLIIAKWLGLISKEDYDKIINNPNAYFDKSDNKGVPEEYIQKLVGRGFTRSQAIAMLGGDDEDNISAESLALKVSSLLSSVPNKDILSSDLIEFDTLLYPQKHISYEKAVGKLNQIDLITKEEVDELMARLGISFSQVSQSVKIVNYSYGYTRMASNPSKVASGKKLALNAFNNNGTKYKVFTSILETEGILLEFDKDRIIKWLIDNDFYDDDLDTSDELKKKVFFMNNINLDSINCFQNISVENIITKAVYSLLHTMAHMFIQSAGINSGLSKDSLSEIIFPNIPAVFIYPTTIQGITLGSVSGMYESKMVKFLEDALEMNEICTFDPICNNSQNGACLSCTFISDVSCAHFNKDLSRAYLYGGTIKENGVTIEIKKGFWK